MTQEKRPKIGLALSGGAARGLAHIGVLQELERAGVPIDCIAGTSSGALVGALYAAGKPPEEMIAVLPQMKWSRLVAFRPTRRSIVSGNRLIRFLEHHCPVTQIEALQIPLAVVVCDLETGESVPFTRGALFPVLMASCSIPFLFPPIRLNGREYIDGGFAELLPAQTARNMGADIVVACDVNYQSLSNFTGRHFVSLCVKLIVHVAHKAIQEAKAQTDVVINVDARGIGLAALGKADEMLERGRQAVKEVLPELQDKTRFGRL